MEFDRKLSRVGNVSASNRMSSSMEEYSQRQSGTGENPSDKILPIYTNAEAVISEFERRNINGSRLESVDDFLEILAENNSRFLQMLLGPTWSEQVSRCVMSSVLRLSTVEAMRKIKISGMQIGRIYYEYSDHVPQGQIAGQFPAPGRKILRGSHVKLVVSKGVGEANMQPEEKVVDAVENPSANVRKVDSRKISPPSYNADGNMVNGTVVPDYYDDIMA